MSITLIINLAYEPFGFSLLEKNDVIVAVNQRSSRKFSETIIDQIKQQCVYNSISFEMLTCIGVVNGPGSYTGLRIGISVAKTIALALNIPVYSCSAFEAIANQIPVLNSTYAVVLPSKKSMVYFQLFNQQKGALANPISEPVCMSLDQLYHVVSKFNNSFNVVGLLEAEAKRQIAKIDHINFFESTLSSTGIYSAISTKINTNAKTQFKELKPFYFHEPNIGIIKKNISRFKSN